MQVDRTQQRAITRLCIQCGLFLLQHGAESALVEELSTRLGLALGMDSVESAISSNAIVLTTIKNGECLTSTRKNVDRVWGGDRLCMDGSSPRKQREALRDKA